MKKGFKKLLLMPGKREPQANTSPNNTRVFTFVHISSSRAAAATLPPQSCLARSWEMPPPPPGARGVDFCIVGEGGGGVEGAGADRNGGGGISMHVVHIYMYIQCNKMKRFTWSQ